jgi:hypothetical protein
VCCVASSRHWQVSNANDAKRASLQWGASLLPSRANQGKNHTMRSRPRGPSTRVRTVDLAGWLWKEVHARALPAVGSPMHVAAGEYQLIMKLDIEGAEYEVLPRLLSSGTLSHGSHSATH